jgi:hypothetical protein
MIPFHIIYSWLFKSFRIDAETDLLDRLVKDWYNKFIIVKRSWIFALFIAWIPLMIICLSGISIAIAYTQIPVAIIAYTIIIANVLMSAILIVSSVVYIHHFHTVHSKAQIFEDHTALRAKLELGDTYFTRFFNWTITNQVILFIAIILEIIFMILYRNVLWDHVWVLSTDLLVMFSEIVFLRIFRKKMIDLEMDFNMVVPGKIFFVNQTGVLSSVQSIESGKIKTVRSLFPNKIASFFNYGTIDILTEGDTTDMLGTMTMYYVTDPDGVVASIQTILKEARDMEGTTIVESQTIINENTRINSDEHAFDTREKIRDVLR